MFTVLSIEDNEPDFVLIKRGLEQVKDISYNIINIKNGKEAMQFLYKIEKFIDAPSPDIILLDINIPLMDGHEILRIIKKDYNLKKIPVIILSTSEFENDISEAYDEYANSYVLKTFEIDDLLNKIYMIAEYWIKVNKSPKEKEE